MSSTSSSDSRPRARSATEILSSRYRHLFVLPSTPLLLVFAGIATLFLTLLARGLAGSMTFVPSFAVFILSGFAVSSALQVIDRKTIATFRRSLALLFGAEILWLLIGAVGAAYGWFTGSAHPLTNALLFGAFTCAGFEFLVINGAFEKRTGVSLVLASIHPASTLIILRGTELTANLDYAATLSGILALATFVLFLVLLKRMKTSLGHDAPSLFRAFMKTWTARRSDELEGIIADHSEEIEVTTKVLRFRTKSGDTFLVLPGVHPGPFHPIGSYDLPGVVSRAFKEIGPVMTLHRPGGHEHNLATSAETLRYAEMVRELGQSIATNESQAVIRGPIHAQVGKATVSASAFSDDMIMTISFAPRGSDDIDTRVETELTKPASEFGLDLSIVDAHNSIDPILEAPVMDDTGWKQLCENTSRKKPERFSVAYSHSSEVGFKGQSDITENGIGLFLVQVGSAKHALILADANNSVPNLREEVSKALKASGYELIEFCTSDSHNLAARGLTVERGYEALGEATTPASIADLAVRMARLADARLLPAEYGSAKTSTRVKVFGSKALEEFAAITQSSSKFSRAYFRLAAFAVAALLIAAIVF